MRLTLPLLLFLLLAFASLAEWPREITTKNGAIITVYQPQPEKLNGAMLDGRCAFSAVEKKGDEPIFGVFWFAATIATDRDARTLTLETLKVSDVKLPGLDDEQKILRLRQLLEVEIPTWQLTGSLDELNASIEQEQAYVSDELKNDPPKILYASQATTLVLIDGEPKLADDKDLKMKRVINSAFLIVENPSDKKYYLNGGSRWFVSPSMKEGYQPASSLPKPVADIDKQMKQQQKEKATDPGTNSPAAILVSTEPAELIQTSGEAQYANIQETALLYVTNSSDDLFKNVTDNQYFVLLSGRWYSSPKLEGPWTYVAADKLPADFAKIPEGSSKDNVLSSVAGTKASKDAIHDAQVPQTAKVDRKKATASVTYDGEPKFEIIEGTSLELAMNTSSTVLKSGAQYFCVDKGVWFVSTSAKGPWKVSDIRPKDVEKIPASSSAYNVKYVYVYDATPDVVYVGYTPGYMGCYVYGPTVVYGTGYYYSPWYGPYYYPRPVTYGFSMHYNPWCGWSMGFHYSSGFFHMSIYGGGYWGPPMYRPPYYPPYRGGMYGGRGPTYIHNGDINIDRSNNIYNNRNDVSTRDVQRGQNNGGASAGTSDRQRPGQQRGASQQPAGNRGRNDVYSDKGGNVYQRGNDGNWQQRQGNQWQQTQQTQQLGKDYDSRQRGAQQNSSFQQMNRGGNLGGGMRGGGGGMRGGGGRRR
jgi:hypothetical protein